jgi:hypothetical protein
MHPNSADLKKQTHPPGIHGPWRRILLLQLFYNFHGLMYLRNPVAKKNKVVESYGVTGIPAKFVIDKTGKIRFQLKGFNGETTEAVDELSAMIELAKGAGGN